MNTNTPKPAAIRPGSNTTGSVAPPKPAASMMITVPMTGEPKMVARAANAAAAVSTCLA